MAAKQFHQEFIKQQILRMQEIVQFRGNVERDDLEYLVDRVEKMKDDRLRSIIAQLVGWGDDERAELETFIAIAVEVMKSASPSRLREAARTVELRYFVNHKKEAPTETRQVELAP